MQKRHAELLAAILLEIPVIGFFTRITLESQREWHAWEKRKIFSHGEFVMRRKVNGEWQYRECTTAEREEAEFARHESIAGWN